MIKSVTLLELVVVIIIIGILASMALPLFSKTKERAFDKEAIANLKLIQAAEKIYHMEYTFYYPYTGYAPANTSDINKFLKLALPAGTSRNWNYTIPTAETGTAQAMRTTGSRNWTLSVTTVDEPTCSPAGACSP